MNLLVASFWEGLVHATAFALLGILVYLVLRRWSPAAGALAAGSSLVVMAVVAILAFCPWPRWVPGDSLETLRLAIVNFSPRSVQGARWKCQPHRQNRLPRGPLRCQAARRSLAAPEKPTMAFALLQSLAREWGKPAAVESRVSWSWRSWLAMAMLGSVALGMIRLARACGQSAGCGRAANPSPILP